MRFNVGLTALLKHPESEPYWEKTDFSLSQQSRATHMGELHAKIEQKERQPKKKKRSREGKN